MSIRIHLERYTRRDIRRCLCNIDITYQPVLGHFEHEISCQLVFAHQAVLVGNHQAFKHLEQQLRSCLAASDVKAVLRGVFLFPGGLLKVNWLHLLQSLRYMETGGDCSKNVG